MLPLAVRFYVAATAVVAAAAALLLAVVDQGDVVDRPWLVAVFGALIALEHLFETRLVLDREQGESYGHEESYFVAMALLASPIAVVLAFAFWTAEHTAPEEAVPGERAGAATTPTDVAAMSAHAQMERLRSDDPTAR